MKKIIYLLLLAPLFAIAQSNDQNYIRTWTFRDSTQVRTDSSKTISSIIYYDGIGRPKQSVAVEAGGWKQHQFTPIVYDAYGRQSKEYLPYANPAKVLITLDCKETYSLISSINSKYSTWPDISVINPNPYSETILEASPLNRSLEQGAPGLAWLANPSSDNDHTVKYDYQSNKADEVKRFSVSFPVAFNTESSSLVYSGTYAANTLYKTITKDENWIPLDGLNKTTEEFRDKNGRVILKRGYNNSQRHDTYYVYDKFSNLCYVIPPLGSDQILERLFFPAFQNINYPWTKFVVADATLADAYERRVADYDNSEILNLDLLSEYGAQGGFSITPNSNGGIIVDVNITTASPMPLKLGDIVSLDDLGTFQDKEIGKLSGQGYEYYFLISNNTLKIDGYGNVPSVTASLTGDTPLDYQQNYPWTKLFSVDSQIAQDYEEAIRDLYNDQILTAVVPNTYDATGGISASLDENDTVTLSININSNEPLKLQTGAVLPLEFNRAIDDRELGTVSGTGYSYAFSIKNNVLNIVGSGLVGHLTLSGSFGRVTREIRQSALNGLCYIYYHDKRNRVIEKHVPGRGWQHIVYDKMDRPVFTQDEEQRAGDSAEPNKPNWLFTKYDDLSRVIYTGEFYDVRNRKDLQDHINNLQQGTMYHEHRILPGTFYQGVTIDYSMELFPANVNIFTINYYDDYKFSYEGLSMNPANNYYGKGMITAPTGLLAGTKVRVLGTEQWITTIPGYDDKGRQIWNIVRNQFLDSEIITHQNLNFSGLPVATRTEHRKLTSGFSVKTEDLFVYDHMNRLKRQTKKVNGGTEEHIVTNSYDELGRLVSKQVGGTYDPLTSYEFDGGMQGVDFSYNIRGWLRGINKVTDNLSLSTNTDLFALDIVYNQAMYSGNVALYNGNISGIRWRTKNDNNLRAYGFLYDALNRLTEADVKTSYYYANYPTQVENYQEGPITYDKNGNIKSLERWGLRETATTPPTMVTDKIDILTYTYMPSSNQLLKVTDAGGSKEGFINGASANNDDYKYDLNGNIVKDLNKGIGEVAADEITYNHLNLPVKITFNDGKWIEFTYDATGIKLKKEISTGTTTYYDNSFVYQDNTLQYFPHTEGYVEYASGNFSYIYQYRDHLGNVRMSYKKSGTAITILNENNYYPFGLEHQEYNNVQLSSNLGEKIKYNGKEFQEDLNLNWYDYFARNYDPALGRWFNVDPLAEISRRWSPYNYCYNNPVYFIDPDGMQATPSSDTTLKPEDISIKVNVGNGIMRDVQSVGASASFSGGTIGLSKTGKTKLDKQLDAAFPVSNAYPKGADSRAPAAKETVDEVISKVPILKELNAGFGDKFDIVVNSNFQHSSGADAITDPRHNGGDPEPLGRPVITFYGASFSDGYRGLGHTVLHEFGHVDSYLSKNFFRNYLTEGGNWNRAVYLDEDYAYKFAHRHGGHSPDTYHSFQKAWDKYYASKRLQIKGF